VGRWLKQYAQGGLHLMLSIGTPPGRHPQLSVEALSQLQARLAQPEGFASYKAIQAYLEEEHGLHLSYSRVHTIVRYQLRAKLKVPRKSHRKKTLSRSPRLSKSFQP
jgi:transposase